MTDERMITMLQKEFRDANSVNENIKTMKICHDTQF